MNPSRDPALRISVGVAAVLTLAFFGLAVLNALREHWLLVLVFGIFAGLAGLMTWFRWTRRQPISFGATAISAAMGKKAWPPKQGG